LFDQHGVVYGPRYSVIIDDQNFAGFMVESVISGFEIEHIQHRYHGFCSEFSLSGRLKQGNPPKGIGQVADALLFAPRKAHC
jgi:hypothetical protein